MKSSGLGVDVIEEEYRRRYAVALQPIAAALQEHVADCFREQPRIDRVTARAKRVKSFVEKAIKEDSGERKYIDPLNQIQDQIGCRVVALFLSDVDRLDSMVTRYFRAIEHRNHIPESEWEFGYFGRHYVLLLPEDAIDARLDRNLVPRVFELQIKTLFQHAWSEAEHDLGYKTGNEPLTSEQKRLLAFASAQAWGADRIFNELFHERNVLVADA